MAVEMMARYEEEDEIEDEEYNSAEALLESGVQKKGKFTVLHSPSGQEGNDDDSDANSDVEEL